MILRDLATSDEYCEQLSSRLDERGPQDSTDYIEFLYEELFGRAADPSGREHYAGLVSTNLDTRRTVAIRLIRADEHVKQLLEAIYPLPNIREVAPDRFVDVEKIDRSGVVPCYIARSDADFDWIEQRIETDGYYDRPGIWGTVVDDDKRRLAALIAALGPTKTLDLGCANGAVVACLADLGIDAYGVDISSAAIAAAIPSVVQRVFQADVRELVITEPYDLVYGLDIFEHVQPRSVGGLIGSIGTLLTDDGLLFANIPAFGDDEIFGTVFELYLEPWLDSMERGSYFELLHVDPHGFPMHGHLTWADTAWWQRQFEAEGFTRDVDLERSMQAEFGSDFRSFTPSRSSFYIFRKTPA